MVKRPENAAAIKGGQVIDDAPDTLDLDLAAKGGHPDDLCKLIQFFLKENSALHFPIAKKKAALAGSFLDVIVLISGNTDRKKRTEILTLRLTENLSAQG